MKCHSSNGHFIPGCYGSAFAMGCGRGIGWIKSMCTCPKDETPLELRINKLEKEIKILKEKRK